METITIVLLMLLLVVMSGFVVRMLPWPVPLPLVQIGLGALIASVTSFDVTLQPDIFFLLFLPPLLFLDGWRIPKAGLFRDIGTILELSFGLVIVTVIGLGFFINWLIPSMPLAVAFALAAVLSPTDPVAVAAISKRVPIPKRLMHILEGESLLNDASGLVCLRFAVAAAMTGTFSLPTAAGTFVWLVSGGLLTGIVVTWVVVRAKGWLTRRLGEESGSQILISLLIPFGAYLAAEHLHCSGILAAVSAGITMSYVELSGHVMTASTRVRRNVVWDAVQFSANGVIFVLLGQQMPKLTEGAARIVRETGHHDELWLVLYVVILTLSLAVLRFVWVWVSLRFTMMRASIRKQEIPRMQKRLIGVMSVAGVRGAVTLAGVLTLPLVMTDGSPFPARDLAIFLAAWVIILSLIMASVAMPHLMRGLTLPPEPSHQTEEDIARSAFAKAAMAAIEKAQVDMAEKVDTGMSAEAATRVLDDYRHRLDQHLKTGEEKDYIVRMEMTEQHFHVAALKAGRIEIIRLVRSGLIGDDVMRKLVREIDLMEARYHT